MIKQTYIWLEECFNPNVCTFEGNPTNEEDKHDDIGERCCKVYGLKRRKIDYTFRPFMIT